MARIIIAPDGWLPRAADRAYHNHSAANPQFRRLQVSMSAMNVNPQLMTAVERLGYRVTTGDVVAQTGMPIELARSGLLDLASRTGGNLQVTDTGEVVYAMRADFRQVLRTKYFRLQLQAWLDRVWKIVFYVIKISFGIILIASIIAVYLTILAITLAAIFSNNRNSDFGDLNGLCVLDIFNTSSYISSNNSVLANNNSPVRAKTQRKSLNFLEAVFSVLFGDGDPNADLEQRRWSYISNLIHRQQGVAIAEQIAPYLDDLGQGYDREYENYMLPVLTKFNGIPEVSPTGDLVYHFPDLQTTLKADSNQSKRSPQILRERKWKFSQATPTQKNWAFGLFAANLGGIILLTKLLAGSTLGGWVGIVLSLLAIYGVGLVTIPIVRYILVSRSNERIRRRNQTRHQHTQLLRETDSIAAKLDYANQFAKQHQITQRDIIYTTEEDALTQEFKRLE